MTRLLFLAPQAFQPLRGVCIANLQAIAALARLGWRVDVLSFPGGETPAMPGARFHTFCARLDFGPVPIGFSWRKVLLDLLLAASLVSRLLRERYDAVHASEESFFVAALLKPFFGFRLVYDMDDILSQRLEQAGVLSGTLLRLARAVEGALMRAADLVVANSEHTARRAAEAVGQERVLRYDHAPFDSDGPAVELLAPPPTYGAGCELVVYAGNLEPYQGVGLLLESLPDVLRRRPRALCLVVGGEPEQVESLRRRARELGLSDGLSFLGKLPLEESFALMRAAAVLVSPVVQAKAVPMKLYAYLAAGRPIVATNLPNNTELLDEDSALLVAPHPCALADGLVRVLENPSLARRLAEGAQGLPARRPWRSPASCLREAYARLA